MATKLRLQRRGRKNYPFYQIIVADSRAPRDGKYIERIGSYNPNTHPATITLDFDRALYWLQTGAQPTDTVRNILSDEGVLMKKHLLGGVAKGAFDEAEAEKRFETWKAQKLLALRSIKSEDDEKRRADEKARLEAEKEVYKAKAEALAQKRAEEDAANAPEVEAAPQAEEPAAVEEPAKEEPVAEKSAVEEPAKEEKPAVEEKAAKEETPVAEEKPVVEEKPVAQEKPAAEEKPAPKAEEKLEPSAGDAPESGDKLPETDAKEEGAK